MNYGLMAEMAEIASLGARARKPKCPKGQRKVKRPDGVFVCINKKPCPAGYRFNVKQFKCLATAKTKKQFGGPTAPPGFPGLPSQLPGSFLPVEPGFDDTGIPGNVYVPPGGGQGPVAIDPLTGQPYPGQVQGKQCTGIDQYGRPAYGTIDPVTGQCYDYSTCPPGGGPCRPLTAPGGLPQPIPQSGPSALYPYGGGGGFQQPFGGAMPGAPVQFDSAGGGADFGEGGGSDDFIPSDAQMNLTPPGMPQQQFQPQQQFFQPAEPSFDSGGGEQEFPSEEFQSGGTDEAAYSDEGSMEGLSEGEVQVSPLAMTITQYRDIALETAERFRDVRDSFKKPKPPKPDPAPAMNTWLLLGLAAGVSFLAYKQYKK